MLWSEVSRPQMQLPVAQGQATSVVLAQQGPPKERGTHIVALNLRPPSTCCRSHGQPPAAGQ